MPPVTVCAAVSSLVHVTDSPRPAEMRIGSWQAPRASHPGTDVPRGMLTVAGEPAAGVVPLGSGGGNGGGAPPCAARAAGAPSPPPDTSLYLTVTVVRRSERVSPVTTSRPLPPETDSQRPPYDRYPVPKHESCWYLSNSLPSDQSSREDGPGTTYTSSPYTGSSVDTPYSNDVVPRDVQNGTKCARFSTKTRSVSTRPYSLSKATGYMMSEGLSLWPRPSMCPIS